MNALLFVYGTLKKGCRNHAHLADQTFVGAARSIPGFGLFDLGSYPGIVADPQDSAGVIGEVWSVSYQCLEELDAFEGVHRGFYRRAAIPLVPPFADQKIEAYIYALSIAGRRRLGPEWEN